MNLPHLDGWHLLGAFPDGAPDDVGSWLLHHHGEALLLELPPGVTPAVVRAGLKRLNATLLYVTASHNHCDHLDGLAWGNLRRAFPVAEFLHPSEVEGDHLLHVGGEPAWLIKGPKHSRTDVVTVFRGVAMTGDIELMILGSVNDEVPVRIRRKSMAWFAGFPERTGYHVHTAVSAHLNSVRQGVTWPDLFAV